MEVQMSYHYGQTIKEYRIASKMTLEQLASRWPSKETGVNIRYVIDVEAGKKRITDMETLRKLATVLNVPLWKFGLSEYNPFNQNNLEITFTNITNDYGLIDSFIKQIWVTKVTSGIDVDKHIRLLEEHFQKIFTLYPEGVLIRQDMYGLYAQVKRLQAVRAYDNKNYSRTLTLFQEMLNIAKKDNNPVSLALSNMGIGIELLRAKELDQGLDHLEQSRDYTFHTSKELAALVHSMLSRAYAEKGDILKFERAYNVALSLGASLKNERLNMHDYVFHSLSGLMLEVSSGYIMLNNPQKSLEILPLVEKQIETEQNIYLNMWVPLDYSQAYMEENELEESLKYLGQFEERTHSMKTKHIESRIREHLSDISAQFGKHPLIDQFRKDH
jgi:transcriptional regulator with XRE-family HTH domain